MMIFGNHHEIHDEIYNASLEILLALAERIDPSQTTLILGHNPGCEMLVATLSGEYHRMMPATCALFTKVDDGWNMEGVLRPGELD